MTNSSAVHIDASGSRYQRRVLLGKQLHIAPHPQTCFHRYTWIRSRNGRGHVIRSRHEVAKGQSRTWTRKKGLYTRIKSGWYKGEHCCKRKGELYGRQVLQKSAARECHGEGSEVKTSATPSRKRKCGEITQT